MSFTLQIPKTKAQASQFDASRRTSVHLVDKIGAILSAVSTSPGGLTIAEIAQSVDLPRTTVQRLVEALVGRAFLMQTGSGKTYRLGFLIRELAGRMRWSVGEVCGPLLRQLAMSTGETVAVATRQSASLIYTDMFHAGTSLQVFVEIGRPMTMHALASGKAILAQLNEIDLQRLKSQMKLTAITPHTLTSWTALEAALREVRETGIATDHEENAMSVNAVAKCVAVPTFDPFAVSIAGPSHRLNPREAGLGQALGDCCRQIETLLQGLDRQSHNV